MQPPTQSAAQAVQAFPSLKNKSVIQLPTVQVPGVVHVMDAAPVIVLSVQTPSTKYHPSTQRLQVLVQSSPVHSEHVLHLVGHG